MTSKFKWNEHEHYKIKEKFHFAWKFSSVEKNSRDFVYVWVRGKGNNRKTFVERVGKFINIRTICMQNFMGLRGVFLRFQEQTFYFHLSPNQKSNFIETSCDVEWCGWNFWWSYKSLAEAGLLLKFHEDMNMTTSCTLSDAANQLLADVYKLRDNIFVSHQPLASPSLSPLSSS